VLLLEQNRTAEAESMLREGIALVPQNTAWPMLLARMQKSGPVQPLDDHEGRLGLTVVEHRKRAETQFPQMRTRRQLRRMRAGEELRTLRKPRNRVPRLGLPHRGGRVLGRQFEVRQTEALAQAVRQVRVDDATGDAEDKDRRAGEGNQKATE